MITEEMIKLIRTSDLKAIYQTIKLELRDRRIAESLSRRRNFITTIKPYDFTSIDEARAAVAKTNSSTLLALRNINAPYVQRLQYFEFLMSQDWSSAYPRDSETGDYYVYAHVNPSARIFSASKKFGGNYGGEPFYIGKGIGNRAYDLKRNQGHGKALRQCLAANWTGDDIVKIVMSGLSENKALEMESKLIYFFGTIYEERKHGILFNLDVPRIPQFKGNMVKIITRKQIEHREGQEDLNEMEAVEPCEDWSAS